MGSSSDGPMRILLAGASGGIGSAIAAAAEAAGHVVVRLDRAGLEAPEKSLGGVFDAFVFAAGRCAVRPVSRLSDRDLAEDFRVNCGLFVGVVREIVARKMHAPGGMKIAAVSSVSAIEGWPGGTGYCASKGALSAACRALDAELRPKGISVVAFEPRYIKTRMFDEFAGRMGVPASAALLPEEFAATVMGFLATKGDNA